jgi:hypothetical protein
MTVGEYAGVPLQDPGDTWRHGAVFLLRKKAGEVPPVMLGGWVTALVPGQKAMVTCGPSTATDFDATFIEALDAANRALDYLSVSGWADCVIRDAPDDCLVWWANASGNVVIRCRAVQTFGIELSATAEVRDANGNIVPSPPRPTPLADHAFRFIRMSRTSDDLYDSYRNLFLAFESLLSDLHRPQPIPIRRKRRRRCWPFGTSDSAVNTKRETEEDWFMNALDRAAELAPLEILTPSNVTNHKSWIYRRMYQRERSGLMHAKREQNYLLPHDTTDRSELIESLGRLWNYIENLMKEHLQVDRRSGSMSRYAIEQTLTGTLPTLVMAVSDDDGSTVNPDAENLISASATVVQLHPHTSPRADPGDPELWRMRWRCNPAELAGLSAIRRFGQMRPDGSGACDVLSEFVGPMVLGDGIRWVEVESGLRHVAVKGPPRRFSS